MVAIVDYGLGNLRSVVGAVERLGHEAHIASAPSELEGASHLILPGVGAFRDGMANLRARGFVLALERHVQADSTPLLGICLGAQLLAHSSEEFGQHQGLGWIPADVKRIDSGPDHLRVPHVGWNEVRRTGVPSRLLDGIPDQALFYFVHSYHIAVHDPGVATGECVYGTPLTAVVEHGNVYGTQFHPEKSQRHGLAVLENFLRAR